MADETATMGNHAGLRPDSRLTPELIRAYTERGEWTGQPLRSLLTRAASRHGTRLAAVSASADPAVPAVRLSYAELDDAVHRLAAGLRAIGIGPGDSVAVMLPNQAEFAMAIWAILEIGAVYTGIPVSYGERETRLILRRAGSRCAVIPARFRGVRHLDMFRTLRESLPSLRTVVVTGGEARLGAGELPWESLLTAGQPHVTGPDVKPDDLAHVGFTSGTTGEPKGVMNSHQTLLAVLHRFVDHVGTERFGDPMVNLVCSPVGHHTGFLWGVLASAYLNGTAVYLDRWEAGRAGQLIQEFGVTAMFGAPTFLQDLLGQRSLHGRLPTLRTAVVAGAPVPRGLVDQADRAFGTWICPAWGMTEYGIGIACRPGGDERFARTDGIAVAGCEARIVDAAATPVPPDTTGRLQIRGAGLFLGYLGRPDAMRESFSGDWFDTGDLARADAAGFIVIGGRTKDIIIRGGENIPVTEVESLLFDHP
jgi:cyclohexanecarboxylate-CoA ligase